MAPRDPLRPDRLRALERPFGWLPCRLLTDGFLSHLSPHSTQLYLMLALAADRKGLSFWGDPRIQRSLGFTQATLHQARQELIEKDLLAYNGHHYQLLSLPKSPREPQPQTANRTPVKRPQPPESIPNREPPTEMPEPVRQALRRLWGQWNQQDGP